MNTQQIVDISTRQMTWSEKLNNNEQENTLNNNSEMKENNTNCSHSNVNTHAMHYMEELNITNYNENRSAEKLDNFRQTEQKNWQVNESNTERQTANIRKPQKSARPTRERGVHARTTSYIQELNKPSSIIEVKSKDSKSRSQETCQTEKHDSVAHIRERSQIIESSSKNTSENISVVSETETNTAYKRVLPNNERECENVELVTEKSIKKKENTTTLNVEDDRKCNIETRERRRKAEYLNRMDMLKHTSFESFSTYYNNFTKFREISNADNTKGKWMEKIEAQHANKVDHWHYNKDQEYQQQQEEEEEQQEEQEEQQQEQEEQQPQLECIKKLYTISEKINRTSSKKEIVCKRIENDSMLASLCLPHSWETSVTLSDVNRSKRATSTIKMHSDKLTQLLESWNFSVNELLTTWQCLQCECSTKINKESNKPNKYTCHNEEFSSIVTNNNNNSNNNSNINNNITDISVNSNNNGNNKNNEVNNSEENATVVIENRIDVNVKNEVENSNVLLTEQKEIYYRSTEREGGINNDTIDGNIKTANLSSYKDTLELSSLELLPQSISALLSSPTLPPPRQQESATELAEFKSVPNYIVNAINVVSEELLDVIMNKQHNFGDHTCVFDFITSTTDNNQGTSNNCFLYQVQVELWMEVHAEDERRGANLPEKLAHCVEDENTDNKKHDSNKLVEGRFVNKKEINVEQNCTCDVCCNSHLKESLHCLHKILNNSFLSMLGRSANIRKKVNSVETKVDETHCDNTARKLHIASWKECVAQTLRCSNTQNNTMNVIHPNNTNVYRNMTDIHCVSDSFGYNDTLTAESSFNDTWSDEWERSITPFALHYELNDFSNNSMIKEELNANTNSDSARCIRPLTLTIFSAVKNDCRFRWANELCKEQIWDKIVAFETLRQLLPCSFLSATHTRRISIAQLNLQIGDIAKVSSECKANIYCDINSSNRLLELINNEVWSEHNVTEKCHYTLREVELAWLKEIFASQAEYVGCKESPKEKSSEGISKLDQLQNRVKLEQMQFTSVTDKFTEQQNNELNASCVESKDLLSSSEKQEEYHSNNKNTNNNRHSKEPKSRTCERSEHLEEEEFVLMTKTTSATTTNVNCERQDNKEFNNKLSPRESNANMEPCTNFITDNVTLLREENNNNSDNVVEVQLSVEIEKDVVNDRRKVLNVFDEIQDNNMQEVKEVESATSYMKSAEVQQHLSDENKNVFNDNNVLCEKGNTKDSNINSNNNNNNYHNDNKNLSYQADDAKASMLVSEINEPSTLQYDKVASEEQVCEEISTISIGASTFISSITVKMSELKKIVFATVQTFILLTDSHLLTSALPSSFELTPDMSLTDMLKMSELKNALLSSNSILPPMWLYAHFTNIINNIAPGNSNKNDTNITTAITTATATTTTTINGSSNNNDSNVTEQEEEVPYTEATMLTSFEPESSSPNTFSSIWLEKFTSSTLDVVVDKNNCESIYQVTRVCANHENDKNIRSEESVNHLYHSVLKDGRWNANMNRSMKKRCKTVQDEILRIVIQTLTSLFKCHEMTSVKMFLAFLKKELHKSLLSMQDEICSHIIKENICCSCDERISLEMEHTNVRETSMLLTRNEAKETYVDISGIVREQENREYNGMIVATTCELEQINRQKELITEKQLSQGSHSYSMTEQSNASKRPLLQAFEVWHEMIDLVKTGNTVNRSNNDNNNNINSSIINSNVAGAIMRKHRRQKSISVCHCSNDNNRSNANDDNNDSSNNDTNNNDDNEEKEFTELFNKYKESTANEVQQNNLLSIEKEKKFTVLEYILAFPHASALASFEKSVETFIDKIVTCKDIVREVNEYYKYLCNKIIGSCTLPYLYDVYRTMLVEEVEFRQLKEQLAESFAALPTIDNNTRLTSRSKRQTQKINVNNNKKEVAAVNERTTITTFSNEFDRTDHSNTETHQQDHLIKENAANSNKNVEVENVYSTQRNSSTSKKPSQNVINSYNKNNVTANTLVNTNKSLTKRDEMLKRLRSSVVKESMREMIEREKSCVDIKSSKTMVDDRVVISGVKQLKPKKPRGSNKIEILTTLKESDERYIRALSVKATPVVTQEYTSKQLANQHDDILTEIGADSQQNNKGKNIEKIEHNSNHSVTEVIEYQIEADDVTTTTSDNSNNSHSNITKVALDDDVNDDKITNQYHNEYNNTCNNLTETEQYADNNPLVAFSELLSSDEFNTNMKNEMLIASSSLTTTSSSSVVITPTTGGKKSNAPKQKSQSRNVLSTSTTKTKAVPVLSNEITTLRSSKQKTQPERKQQTQQMSQTTSGTRKQKILEQKSASLTSSASASTSKIPLCSLSSNETLRKGNAFTPTQISLAFVFAGVAVLAVLIFLLEEATDT